MIDATKVLGASPDKDRLWDMELISNIDGRPSGPSEISPTTGIWQTALLELMAQYGVKILRIVPDIDAGIIKITVSSH